MVLIEICVDSPEGAVTATEGGAHRIELCAHLPCGGVTPSVGLMETVRASTPLPVVALVRARAGDFVYSTLELQTMAADVRAAARAGMNGIAVGCLDSVGALDSEAMARLADAAEGLPLICHRAFDHCTQPTKALGQLAELGFRRILTSGAQPTALQGAGAIRSYRDLAGSRITILPGAGIRSHNARALVEATGCLELHASASGISQRPSRAGGPEVGANPESPLRTTDLSEVRALVAAVERL